MSNEKLIPELRFPQFQNQGEWELTSIGEIGAFYYGKSAPKWSLSEDAPTLCVRYGELYTKFDTIITEVKSRTNIEPSDLKFSKGGEILVPRVGERATDFAKNCCYLPFPNIAIGEMISVFETKEFPLFYTHYFRTLWREFAEVVEGQNVKNLYYINLEPIKIGKPSYEEQQKVASCLSSLDEVIAAHSQKLDILKDHKKGLMQNLFPQEGERVPKYRFEEFENDGDWVEEILGELCDVRDGTHDSPKYVSKGYPMITSKNLLSTGMMDFENVSYLCEDDYNQINKRSKVDINDILFGMIGTIGNPVIVKTDGFAIKNVALIKSIGKLNQEFLLHQLKSNYILTQFEKVNAGGILKFIALGIIRNLIVTVPSPKEQDKIASCISSLDLLITSEAEKIEKLKLHKKGLMQSLFPKIID